MREERTFSDLSLVERNYVLERIRSEIKHSTEIVPEQARYLTDPQKCALTEHRCGPITGKYVLYRGAAQDVGEIRYCNVEEYLKDLHIQNEPEA